MKNLISSLFRILSNIIIILLILFLILILGIVLFSKINNLEVEDTVTHIQASFGDDADITLANKDSVDLTTSSSVSISNSGNKNSTFYYDQLDETSKQIYDALNDNISNLKTGTYTIEFSTAFNKLLNTSNGKEQLDTAFQNALDAFFYDHPELFYIDLAKMYLHIKYTTIVSKTSYVVSIAPAENETYLSEGFTSKNVDKAISDVENVKNNLIKSIPTSSSDYEKALKVHNALVKSLEYDSSTSKADIHNIYGALVKNTVVCEGYAKAFKYIMDSLNIECILVAGTATNSAGTTESHMWNYIKLDNNWYGVDVTWDDPIIIGDSTKKIIRHNYFCKGSSVFDESHVINNKISGNGMSFTYPKLRYTDYK